MAYNPSDPQGNQYYKPYPGPYQSHLPLEQRTDLVNGRPPESIMFTRGVQESVPPAPPTKYIGNVANPIQAGADFNRQVYPPTFSDKVSEEFENLGPRTLLGPLGRPIYDNWDQIKQGISKAATGSGGSAGGGGGNGAWSFEPKYPSALQSKYETLYNNAIDRLNKRYSDGGNPIQPLLDKYRQQYYTQTIPGIAHQFGAIPGGQSTGAFRHALETAGRDIDNDLFATQAQFDQGETNNMFRILENSPYDSVYQGGGGGGGAGQQGPSLLGQIAQAAGEYGLDWAADAATGVPISKGIRAARAVKDIYGRVKANQANQPYQAPQYQQQQPQQQNRSETLAERLKNVNPQQQNLLNDISRRAAPGQQLTPGELQQIQAITGGPNAAEDFERQYQTQGRRPTFPRTPQQQARYAGFNRAGVL